MNASSFRVHSKFLRLLCSLALLRSILYHLFLSISAILPLSPLFFSFSVYIRHPPSLLFLSFLSISAILYLFYFFYFLSIPTNLPPFYFFLFCQSPLSSLYLVYFFLVYITIPPRALFRHSYLAPSYLCFLFCLSKPLPSLPFSLPLSLSLTLSLFTCLSIPHLSPPPPPVSCLHFPLLFCVASSILWPLSRHLRTACGFNPLVQLPARES